MRELLQQEFDRLSKDERHHTNNETFYWCNQYKLFSQKLLNELAKPEQDFDLLKATQESLREHMERIKELEAELAKQKALDTKADNSRELGLGYEPEQEPVAWMAFVESFCGYRIIKASSTQKEGYVPVYTAPPRKEWVGLTDEEIVVLYRQIADCTEWAIGGLTHAMPFAHAIEAKLRSKNGDSTR